MVLVEGATAEHSGQLKAKLAQHAAFTISDPPSATANDHLMALFRNMGVASQQQCDFSATINPFESDCWTGRSSVVRYDLRTVWRPHVLYIPCVPQRAKPMQNRPQGR